jgi:hypothetical protein
MSSACVPIAIYPHTVCPSGPAARRQYRRIRQYADYLRHQLPPTDTPENFVILTVVHLPDADVVATSRYFSGLEADGRLKDPTLDPNPTPLIRLIKGVKIDGCPADPTLLAGGKNPLDLINEADGLSPGSYLSDLYGCPARLITRWEVQDKSLSVILQGSASPKPPLPLVFVCQWGYPCIEIFTCFSWIKNK